MWAQRLTTAKPDREQLEVACAALAVALEEPADARTPPRKRDPAADPAPPLGDPQPTV